MGVFNRLRLVTLSYVILIAGFVSACLPREVNLTPILPSVTPNPPKDLQPSSRTSTSPETQVPLSSPSAQHRLATAESTPIGVSQFPDSDQFTWTQIINGLNRPVDIVQPDDKSGRLFILEQQGVIRIFQNSSQLSEPFLDIRDRVYSKGNEQGLLGIALHPQFAQNGEFFLNYTTGSHGDTVIARFHLSSNPDQADPNSEEQLLSVQQPFPNHNGGGLAFGPDGFLYIGLGDGGSAGDPYSNGQSLDTFLGKLLRIDVNHPGNYTIPTNNPFSKGGGRPEIWAYGLRNPWRFTFDHATGDLFIADVGQDKWEEVDFLPSGTVGGANFGWNYREGFHPYQGSPPPGQDFIDPIWEYGHDQGCSITGGKIYRGSSLPEFKGIYLAADFCNGKIWGLLRDASGKWQSRLLFTTGLSISSFGEDADGEIYLLDLNQGGVHKLVRK